MPALWFEPILVLGLAAGLDRLVGDPWHWPHPVQGMGWLIQQGSRIIQSRSLSATGERWAGVGLGLGLMLGSGLVAWGLITLAHRLHPWLGIGCEAVMLASCLAGRSLRQAADAVLAPVATGDLATARQVLAGYVGRDTADLSAAEILRAVMETVSENATDGVMAPLFYAVVGSLIPGLGPVPLAFGYKAASTLDSMVGYRQPPFTHIGWFSARSEDWLTWPPCRGLVFTVALLSGHPRRVWRICCRDAPADPSPNAGWSEAAYAAALGVQLGGVNYYRGQATVKPLLGEPHQPITADRIQAALALTRHSFLLWLGLGSLLVGIVNWGI